MQEDRQYPHLVQLFFEDGDVKLFWLNLQNEKIFGIPTTLKEISHDETENAENGRFTIRLTDRSSGKIPLKNMVMLLSTGYRRTHIDVNGWEISARKLLKEGY